MALDRQLDSLDQALDILEKQSDHLHQEAKQLLLDARAARSQAVSDAPADTEVVSTSSEERSEEKQDSGEKEKQGNS